MKLKEDIKDLLYDLSWYEPGSQEKVYEQFADNILQIISKYIKDFPALKRGKWIMHPDWINRKDLLASIDKESK